ncbi:MAG: hypothetical protein MJ048_06430, partial [Acidaminococcaceae bacterium]|nr:hypothetical protein [Acidaminococcaceae bacterium]
MLPDKIKDINDTEKQDNSNGKDYSAMSYLVKSTKEKENIFLANYREIIAKYIADGNPSQDTLNNYFGRIDAYLNWCGQNHI